MEMQVKANAAAAAAKSLQLCPTLCDPIYGSLPGSSIHGIFQARVLEWGSIAGSCKLGYSLSAACFLKCRRNPYRCFGSQLI